MALKPILTPQKRSAVAIKNTVRKAHKGKPPNVLTPPEKDEIMLSMAEALGFYDPTP